MSVSRNYQLLSSQFLKAARMMQSNELLRWDSLQRLPSSPETRTIRARVRRTVQLTLQQTLTNKGLDAPLAAVLNARVADTPSDAALTQLQRSNVGAMRRWRDKSIRLENENRQKDNDTNFRQQSQAHDAWVQCVAGEGKYWQHWATPHFDNLVRIARQEGKGLAANTRMDPYDALVAAWEPGLTCATIDSTIVEPVSQWLPMAVKYGKQQRSAATKNKSNETEAETSQMGRIQAPAEQQIEFLRTILLPAFGFDATTRGRVDAARHDIPEGETVGKSATLAISPDDVRIIVRCDTDDVLQGILNLLPSVGTALTEQCLPGSGPHPVWGAAGTEGKKLKEFVGHDVTRCHSRCFDNALQELYGKTLTLDSPGFRRWLAEAVARFFEAGQNKEAVISAIEQRLTAASFSSPPSQHQQQHNCAMDAYKHRLLPAEQALLAMAAYSLERGLINGQLEADSAPVYWTSKLSELGLVEDSEREACAISPTHPLSLVCISRRWAAGAFGLWPTELMGSVYRCQLHNALLEGLPSVDENATTTTPAERLEKCVASGDLTPIREWLQCNVWRHGGFLEEGSGVALLRTATNSKFDAGAYSNWLMKSLK